MQQNDIILNHDAALCNEKWTYEAFIHIGLTTLWFFYKGACLITLIEPCHETTQQFQKVQVLVSHLMCASTEKNFKDELSRYYEQCTNNVPTFSPLGICDLTRKFMVQVSSL
ncbi:unnamed protein product [Euphydryas editha]|uniref:Uncharacterized protein n=1 Tax=Euphydryas editha TaxID=104508 RepID=A0AAU9U8H5_EUPED|nr:unnamed protein product [Euphydryas editha]